MHGWHNAAHEGLGGSWRGRWGHERVGGGVNRTHGSGTCSVEGLFMLAGWQCRIYMVHGFLNDACTVLVSGGRCSFMLAWK